MTTYELEQVEPVLTARRRLFRALFRNMMRALVGTVSRYEVEGTQWIPRKGPLLVVMNHLGLLDGPLLLASFPRQLEAVVLDQMLDVPVLGKWLRWYGVLPVRRDRFDRTVLQRSVAVLRSGRALAISPEAGISGSGALRMARSGAAYMALHAEAPVLPVAITGTERVQGAWDSVAEKVSFRGLEQLAFWRSDRPRLELKLIFGRPFDLESAGNSWREKRRALRRGTDEMMERLAALLPSQYQGVYDGALERLGIRAAER